MQPISAEFTDEEISTIQAALVYMATADVPEQTRRDAWSAYLKVINGTAISNV